MSLQTPQSIVRNCFTLYLLKFKIKVAGFNEDENFCYVTLYVHRF
jgi:hypothetical protein